MSLTIKRGFDFQGSFVKPKVPLKVPDPLEYKKLWAHQARFLKELKNEPYWFVVGPPAAGKSLTIAAIVTTKLTKDPTLRAIIAVPQTIIGDGFENTRFRLPGAGNVFFDPIVKLHQPTEQSNQSQLKAFLKRKPASPVNDRVVICTHQSLVLAYKTFPKAFKNVLVVVDEAHHSMAMEVADRTITNGLGKVVVGLVEHSEQVGLATATASRGDGCGLLGNHADKFKVAECPFDDYLKVCRWFQNFTFDFVLYDRNLNEPVNHLLGDKHKRPPRTIIHIPNVNSTVSSGKHNDLHQIYCGIAGTDKPEIKNRSGDGDGITLVKRGSRWVRVVDLVNEHNRQCKKAMIVAAHDDDAGNHIDVIIALNMFKEGANWRWAEKSIITGYRGSFTELTQMVGRSLRDAPEKFGASIHYVLKQHQYDPTDIQVDAMNDYLKALLLVLILEDEFRPVEIRVKNPGTKKFITIKTNLLAEAVGYDTSKKLRIVQAVTDALIQYEALGPREAMKVVVETLEQEGVTHPKLPLGVVAKQIVKMHQRRARTVMIQLTKDVDRFDVKDITLNLIQKNQHPMTYLQYYTDPIGIPTLTTLRTALKECNEQRWQEMYLLLLSVAKLTPNHQEMNAKKKRQLYSWCDRQRLLYKLNKLSIDRINMLVKVPGWFWNTEDKWICIFNEFKQWVLHYHKLPKSKNGDKTESRLCSWGYLQRMLHRYNKLSDHKIRMMDTIPGWTWYVWAKDRWYHAFDEFKQWILKYCKYPTKCGKDKNERRLAEWYYSQLQAYKQFKLSEERIRALESIPNWCWPARDRWLTVFRRILAWEKKHGYNKPSEFSNDKNERYLGKWLCSQKAKYKQGKLSDEQIKKLQRIHGWERNIPDEPKPKLLCYITPKKICSRQESIIDIYRNVFDRKKLPKTKQYWSMCAVCVGPDGNVMPKSELHQIIDAGLIQPQQFHGVDRDKSIYRANQRYEHATWYHDDFYAAISAAADTPGFNPGIVNVDTTLEPRRGVDLFCRVLERLRDVHDVLFVGNFVTQDRWRSYTVDDVVERINQHPRFQEVAHTLRWNPDGAFYHYRGSAKKGCTKMCSVLLWRK
ncbi:MAG: Helicase associated domain protein [Candidatus Portnoybacteria bacterium]|nr:Helicase associated domain protein [Candidatus Portnoybacteria bacterium]